MQIPQFEKPTNVAMFYIEVKANDSIKFGYPNVNNVELRNTNIKYVLVESFESAVSRMFLERY